MENKTFTLLLAIILSYGFMFAQETGKAPIDKANRLTLPSLGITNRISEKGIIWSDVFDNNQGWTLGAHWQIAAAVSQPAYDHTQNGNNGILACPLGSNYLNNMTRTEAVSPVINCSGHNVVILSYWSYSGCESNYYDNIGVEVFNGSTWVEIWHNSDLSFQDTEWTYWEFDVTPYAANNSQFRVRFFLGPTDSSVVYSGWAIDDLRVFYPEDKDLGIIAVNPKFVVNGTAVSPRVTVKNYGAQTQSVWSVQLSINDSRYEHTIVNPGSLSYGQTMDVIFPAWEPEEGIYELHAIVNLADDANPANNEMTIQCVVGDYMTAYTLNSNQYLYQTVDLNTGALETIAPAPLTAFPMAEEFNGSQIYRIHENMSIGVVDPEGIYTHLGYMSGVAGIPTGLAWDWENEIMYVMILDGAYAPKLYTLDLTTFELTLLGGQTSQLMIIGMDFANDGFLYGPAIDTDQLYRINPANAEITEIGPLGIDINFGQDVSYDPVSETLYTISCGDTYAFGYYNLATGAFTSIASVSDQHATFVITNTPDLPDKYMVTFNLDMACEIALGGFDINTDQIFLAGSMNGWITPGDDNTMIVSQIADGNFSLIKYLYPGSYEYKYFKGAGWNGGEWQGGQNRQFVLGEEDLVLNDTWAYRYLLTFVVTDGENVIQNATVNIAGQNLNTGTEGMCHIGLYIGTYSFTVQAEGYADYTGQVILDGEHVTENVVMIVSDVTELEFHGISFYPNPSSGQLHINVDESTVIHLYDLTGRVIMTDVIEKYKMIEVEHSGIYLIRFSNSQINKTEKLIIW
ncbi:MAG: T9SS type A sorting domain-containing protein [Bacteroidales bacterium]|nr:T9SS type A sorting domain-containing protein [Bacteroidales bacterium]